jgi:hypothetical protein
VAKKHPGKKPKIAGNKAYSARLGSPKFKRAPCCIYFYYIGEPTDGYQTVLHYYYTGTNEPIMTEELRTKIKDLVLNARKRSWQNPPPCGSDGRYIVWTRKSYLVIAVDNPSYRFDPNQQAVVFKEPQDTFFDGWDDKINIPDASGNRHVSVFCCINYMKKNAAGDDLEDADSDPPQPIIFDVNPNPLIQVPFPDSGGTNMGPPVPPP